jgi:hypothetical protein
MSCNLVSTVSSPPSVAAAAAPCHRHRHGGGVKPQLRVKHGGEGRTGAADGDRAEDAIDRWRTSGVSPVRCPTLSSHGSLLASRSAIPPRLEY